MKDLVVNAGTEDDVHQGIGDMPNESLADTIWIGIKDLLDMFMSLSAPVARNGLLHCTTKADVRYPSAMPVQILKSRTIQPDVPVNLSKELRSRVRLEVPSCADPIHKHNETCLEGDA